MKKILALLAALVCALSFTAFAACGTKDGGKASDNTDTESGNTEGSADGNTNGNTEGSTEGNANVQLTKTDCTQLLEDVSQLLLNTYVAANSSANVASSVAVSTSEDLIYTQAVGYSSWLLGAADYIYLASLVYNDKVEELTSDPIETTIKYNDVEWDADENEINVYYGVKVYILTGYDSASGNIICQVLYETKGYTDESARDSYVAGETVSVAEYYGESKYVYISAGYDFTGGEISTLLMHIWNMESDSLALSAKYSNDTFKYMDDSYSSEVSATVSVLVEGFQSAVLSPVNVGDCTSQFVIANNWLQTQLGYY